MLYVKEVTENCGGNMLCRWKSIKNSAVGHVKKYVYLPRGCKFSFNEDKFTYLNFVYMFFFVIRKKKELCRVQHYK